MLVRCNTDLCAELVRSSYLTLSVHHYGCTEETSNGIARTRTGSSKVPVQPGPGGNTRSRRKGATEGLRRERRWWVREWILRRPLFGQYETLWPFPFLLAGCCLFLPQFFSSPSLSLTNFDILFIKSVSSESCGYNLLNAVHRQERTVYKIILAEISGRVTAEFRSSSGRALASVPYTPVTHSHR